MMSLACTGSVVRSSLLRSSASGAIASYDLNHATVLPTCNAHTIGMVVLKRQDWANSDLRDRQAQLIRPVVAAQTVAIWPSTRERSRANYSGIEMTIGVHATALVDRDDPTYQQFGQAKHTQPSQIFHPLLKRRPPFWLRQDGF